MLVLVAGLVACSSDSSGDSKLPDPNSPDETSSEAGTYQQTLGSDMKFDEKSAVWIYELDSEFKETGRKFLADRKTEGSITTFVTDSLTLKNRYALVKTEGFRIRSYEVFPMGCNVQLVYYRPLDGGNGDVLVKVMLNEREATLPLTTDQWPYYRWKDVRDFYMDRLDRETYLQPNIQ